MSKAKLKFGSSLSSKRAFMIQTKIAIFILEKHMIISYLQKDKKYLDVNPLSVLD